MRDQTEAKRRKEICAGEDWRQCEVHHEETRGVSSRGVEGDGGRTVGHESEDDDGEDGL